MFNIQVTRIGYATRVIQVPAASRDQAERIALETAGNYPFIEHDAEYRLASRSCLETDPKPLPKQKGEIPPIELLVVVHGKATRRQIRQLEKIVGHAASDVTAIGVNTDVLFHAHTKADAAKLGAKIGVKIEKLKFVVSVAIILPERHKPAEACGAMTGLGSASGTPADEAPSGNLLTIEQQRQYLDGRGSKCPWCGSAAIEGTGHSNSDADWHDNEIICNTCGAVWLDIYTISGVRGVSGPSEKPTPSPRIVADVPATNCAKIA